MEDNNQISVDKLDEFKHSIMNMNIVEECKQYGSLKEAILVHAEDYGIKDIESLFPEPTELNNPPQFIKNKTEWVSKVLGGISRSPFSRIRTTFADITDESLRAKGYPTKGKYKEEAVFGLMRRFTTPCTFYVKRKIDRDDIIDITDFNVVSWIKAEMSTRLDEEFARAILLGDGRLDEDADKIDEECIRPIVSDEDFYSIKKTVDASADANPYKAFIKSCIKARKDYRGSGNPTMFTTEDMLAEMLLIEDKNGRNIYTSVDQLATTLRVKEIITVPVLEGFVRTDKQGGKHSVLAIIVNLADYKAGADKGGKVGMFEDFDIDYNQHKYLMETRKSGALVTPYSAIIMEKDQA